MFLLETFVILCSLHYVIFRLCTNLTLANRSGRWLVTVWFLFQPFTVCLFLYATAHYR